MAKVRTKRYKDKPCRNCEKTFSPVTSWQMDCCTDCHDAFWKDKNPITRIVRIEVRLKDIEKKIHDRQAAFDAFVKKHNESH